MGLFDKKYCDFCGDKIGLLGNRKLADGNMCKDCASDITPYLVGRKQYSVADMKEHLASREANKLLLEGFNPTRSLGINTKVHIDDNQGRLLVTSSRKYKEGNPDIVEFTQVTGCVMDIDEDKGEIKRKNAEGKEESFNPPRYKYSYNFYIIITVNHPWFDEIKFKVNSSSIEGRVSPEYRDTEKQAKELCEALQSLQAQVIEAAKPKSSVNCPACGATTMPDARGCCEYCGAALGG